MSKTVKVIIAALIIAIIALIALWGSGLNEIQSLTEKIKEQSMVLKKSEARAKKFEKSAEDHEKIANDRKAELDKAKSDLENFKKQRPKKKPMPEVCNEALKGSRDSQEIPKTDTERASNTIAQLCEFIVSERKRADHYKEESEKSERVIIGGDDVIIELGKTINDLKVSNSEYKKAVIAAKKISQSWEKKSKKGKLKAFLTGAAVTAGVGAIYIVGRTIVNLFGGK